MTPFIDYSRSYSTNIYPLLSFYRKYYLFNPYISQSGDCLLDISNVITTFNQYPVCINDMKGGTKVFQLPKRIFFFLVAVSECLAFHK